MDCITSSHKRHAFDKIADVVTKEKEVIKTFVETAENIDLPRLISNLASVGEQIQENSKHFESLCDDIKFQGDELKRFIDKTINELTESCKDSERKNYDLLLQRSNEFISLRDKLTARIKHCKEVMRSENDVQVIDAAKDVKTKKPPRPCPPPILDIVTFMARQIDEKKMSNLIGETSITKGQVQSLTEKGNNSVGQQSSAYFKNQTQSARVLKSFLHKSFIVSVQKSSPDSFWVSFNRDYYTSLVDSSGEVQRTVKFESNVQDISVSHKTGSLWACCYDFNIYEDLRDNKPVKRFSTDAPISIVMTSQDTVVVGSVNEVSVFSPLGQTLQTVQKDMLIWPHHIAVCPRTGDIAICDGDLSEWGGSDKPHIVVFDKNLQFRYRHFGPFESREEYTKSEFDPLDAEYDDKGNLFIADHSMSCVRCMSSDGEMFSVVHTDQDKPKALTLLDKGQLCLGCDSKVLKIIQY